MKEEDRKYLFKKESAKNESFEKVGVMMFFDVNADILFKSPVKY